MSEHRSFYRKITYLVLIAVLLFPISQLGAPATVEDRGGLLARLRSDHELGQADLGEIDPSSETIRLATLGLRGIAVSLLWSKATEYKKKEDWTNFRATLGQLSKLQPYFISFWRYQAWNLSYNVSVELDDLQDRYHYVKRGIEFLKEGIKYNRFSPYLLSDLGWFIGNKIGRADEHEQYRKMFRLDDDFHPADRPPELRDNWLVSKKWYQDAVSAVDDQKKSLGNKNPTTFFDKPAMAHINYSSAIEEEGTFGEKARTAWATAERLWNDYGNRAMRSSRGIMIQLASYERWEKDTQELEEQLENLLTGAREELAAQRRAGLTPEKLAVLELAEDDLTVEQLDLKAEAEKELVLEPLDFADYIAQKAPEKVAEARKLVNRITEYRNRLFLIRNNRQVSNYEYWDTRCKFEQTAEALSARELAFLARRTFLEGDLLEAKRLYEESFDMWAQVISAFPSVNDDTATGADIMEYILKYREVLEQLDLTLNDDEVHDRFALWDFLVDNDAERKFVEEIEQHKARKQDK